MPKDNNKGKGKPIPPEDPVDEDIEVPIECAEANKIVEVEAEGQQWEPSNPNWIPPEEYPKWCELRVNNGVTGCEVWVRLETTNNIPIWKQIV